MEYTSLNHHCKKRKYHRIDSLNISRVLTIHVHRTSNEALKLYLTPLHPPTNLTWPQKAGIAATGQNLGPLRGSDVWFITSPCSWRARGLWWTKTDKCARVNMWRCCYTFVDSQFRWSRDLRLFASSWLEHKLRHGAYAQKISDLSFPLFIRSRLIRISTETKPRTNL